MIAAKNDDLGGLQGNAMQALAQWRHPVTSSKAWDVLHWAMHPALYRRIRMAIKITSILPALLVVVALIVGHNHC
jgi:hypothetical protein